MYVIVTIPAFNEQECLRETVMEIKQAMEAAGFDSYGILVQDDASTDDTSQIAAEVATYVYRNERHLGLAGTFREEIRNCLHHGADIIVHTDADGQYPARHIPDMIQKIQAGYDLVVGSRFVGGTRYGNSRVRAIQNILFSRLMRILSGFPITDVTSGFRAMNRRTAERIVIRSQFTYTYEQYFQAAFLKLAIAEIPIDGRKTRASKLVRNSFDYGFHAAKDIFRHYCAWTNRR